MAQRESAQRESVTPLRVPAPAKINLHLRVGPPRAGDGFHPLLSWMVTVGLFDNLEFTLTEQPGVVRLSCDDPAIPCDASNLIVKTASALLDTVNASRAASGKQGVGASAALQKRIPVGAGLGGGSSDGAFALLALDRLLHLNLDYPQAVLADLAALASRFGSDLAFFFHGPSSICTGRGEVVRPTPPPTPRHAVLLLPGIHMPTPAVYKRFDEMLSSRSTQGSALNAEPDWLAWSKLSARELLPLLINDLEPPAFSLNADLANLHRQANELSDRPIRMSGSGSTLFTLYDTAAEAERSAEHFRLSLRVDARPVEVCPTSG